MYRILLIALLSVLKLNGALSEYYPHDHNVHPGHGHVKYIEPPHVSHVKSVKYLQPAPIAPVGHLAPIAPVVKHIAPAPHHHKYIQPAPHYVKQVEYDQPAQYEFGYDVHDPHTGDIKSHSEKRDGHTVQGRYEVLDPDGFKRIVEYTADEHNGFNAVVRREPSDIKIAPIAPVHAPQHVKYYAPQHEAIGAPAPFHQKIFTPAVPVHQKVIAKPYGAQPHFYAPPANPKFFKPIDKVTKYVKPSHQYEPYTAVKYVSPAPHYNHY